MKIRELNIVDQTCLNKLSQYADMSIEEYIAWIEERKANRKHVHKLYLEIYDKIIDGQLESSFSIQDEESEEKDEIYDKLEQMPIDEIQYYVDFREYDKNCGGLKRNGIETLGQLYLLHPFSGQSSHEVTARKWKKFLKENYTTVISDFEDFNTIKTFPTEIDKEAGLI